MFIFCTPVQRAKSEVLHDKQPIAACCCARPAQSVYWATRNLTCNLSKLARKSLGMPLAILKSREVIRHENHILTHNRHNNSFDYPSRLCILSNSLPADQ